LLSIFVNFLIYTIDTICLNKLIDNYTDYLVQHPLNYGIIKSIDQSFLLGYLDNYDGSIEQQ